MSVVLKQIKYDVYGRVVSDKFADSRSRGAEALLQAPELSCAAFVANDNLAVEKRANWHLDAARTLSGNQARGPWDFG